MKLIYRDELSWGSIWFAGIKLNLTLETYSLYYKLRKLTDSKFPYRFLLYKSLRFYLNSFFILVLIHLLRVAA